jgi:hypothetical protein
VYGFEAKLSFHLWDTLAFFDSLDYFIKDSPSLSDLQFRDNVQFLIMEFVNRRVETFNEKTDLKQEESRKVIQSKRSPISKKNEEKSSHNSFLWEEVPFEVALIGSSNISLVSSYREEQCAFWKHQGLLDYVWVA